MAKIKVKIDAAFIFRRGISRPHPWAAPTHEEFQYEAALRGLHGLEVPLVKVVEAVSGCVYALMPLTEYFQQFRSRVVIITHELADEIDETNLETPPIEDREGWWKEEKLNVVRLLTPWADGFMAFTPFS